MLDTLLTSFLFRAAIAAMLALVVIAALFAGLVTLLRLPTPRGRKGSRPDPVQGPQEASNWQSADHGRPTEPLSAAAGDGGALNR
jgi:hypothetical protein